MLQPLSKPTRRSSARRGSQNQRRKRPRLELLEDRTAPAVFVVNSTMDGAPAADGQLTLREAINAASTNMSSGDAMAGETTPDTIVFASTLQGQTITLTAGVLDLNANTPNRGDLSIVGPGGVSSGITVDGNNASRVFSVGSNVNEVISLLNLTITGGMTAAGQDGAGLINRGSNTMLTNVAVTGNASGDDGGGLANAGLLTLNNTAVTNNTAADDGGGIYNNSGTLIVQEGSRVSGNSATSAGSNGGGIVNAGTTAAGRVTVTDSTIAGNFSRGQGGGIANGNFTNTTVLVRRSTISGNVTRGEGGGIRNQSTDADALRIYNSTLAENAAGGGQGGGGIRTENNGTVIVVNSTIVGNTDTSGDVDAAGGIGKEDGTGTLTLSNSILALNSSASGSLDVEATDVNSGGDNFLGGLAGDPRLTPLQDNGGPTFTMAPLSGSPVVDAGSNARATETGAAGGAPLTTDQRGFSRIVGGTVDQGAVERFSSSTAVALAVTQPDAMGMEQPLTMMGGMGLTSTARRVTLSATITGATGAPTPTGNVDFYDDSDGDPTTPPVKLNSTPVQVDSMGMAVLPGVALPASPTGMPLTHRLTARFSPSSAAFGSSSSGEMPVQARIADTVGVFDPMGIAFQLLNQNQTTSTGPDFGYPFGAAGSLPVVGNWTGSADGVSKPAAVTPDATGTVLVWNLSDENPPVLPNLGTPFAFGSVGQTPIAGDWNGDGTDGIGVYDPTTSTFLLRNTADSLGPPDFTFTFGAAGFLPVVGDWNGDGSDTVGVYDQATGQWALAGNTPATGFATTFATFAFGTGVTGARPVAGDWDGDGTDGIGIFFPQTGANAGFGGFLLRNDPTTGGADVNGGFPILAGLANWLPVTGNWGPAALSSNPLVAPPPMMPLQALDGPGLGGEALQPGQLGSIVSAALGRLDAAGVDPGVINALATAQYVVGDLGGAWLGAADLAGNRVIVDADAAGHGWFVDPTPLDDSEFGPGGPVGMDLLTVVMHEMGHLAGQGDDSGSDLMGGFLAQGVRQTGALDAVFGSGPVGGVALML
jgi:hypothetical protein